MGKKKEKYCFEEEGETEETKLKEVGNTKATKTNEGNEVSFVILVELR